ncbi:MAG: CPBP family glutamic-type intramembrane protease [Myxococcota bacterium]
MTEETHESSPSPLGAIALTGLAWGVLVLVTVLATPGAGGTLGIALGTVLGLGGVGTFGARAIPAPADRRMGLTGFAPKLLLPVLLLLPYVLLSSELDNWIATLFPPPETEAAAELALEGLTAVELVLFLVLLRPVLEEFFFRGVVQQGVVETLGARRGLLLTALLFALVRASFGLGDAQRALTLAAQALCEGLLFGTLRLASGSIVPGVILAMGSAGVGLFALATKEAFPIPGFNDETPHTPLAWLLPAALSVAGALVWLRRATS